MSPMEELAARILNAPRARPMMLSGLNPLPCIHHRNAERSSVAGGTGSVTASPSVESCDAELPPSPACSRCMRGRV
jgi:hypothetical protein